MPTKISSEGLQSAPTAKLHFIPAETDSSGPANVEKYFENFVKTDQNGVSTNTLRGYPLVGNDFSIPESHQGVILTSAKGDSSSMKITGKFDMFSYWNYDTIPSKNDALRQTMDWIDISRALHGEEEDCA